MLMFQQSTFAPGVTDAKHWNLGLDLTLSCVATFVWCFARSPLLSESERRHVMHEPQMSDVVQNSRLKFQC